MRTLTKSEQKLAWIMGLSAGGILSLLLLGWMQQTQTQLSREYHQLHLEQIESQNLLQNQALWEQRAAWLLKTAPVLGEEGKAQAALLETALAGAREHHLEILEQTLGETVRTPLGVTVSAKIRVTGAMSDLCQWLTGWQDPASFGAITSFSLRPDEADQTVMASLTIKRFYPNNR